MSPWNLAIEIEIGWIVSKVNIDSFHFRLYYYFIIFFYNWMLQKNLNFSFSIFIYLFFFSFLLCPWCFGWQQFIWLQTSSGNSRMVGIVPWPTPISLWLYNKNFDYKPGWCSCLSLSPSLCTSIEDDHDCYLFVLIEFGIRILTTSVITIKSREIHSDSLITIDINETFTDLPNECFDITVKFYFMFHPNFNNYHHNHLGIVNRLRILNNFKHRFRQRNCHSSMPIRFSSLAEQKTNYLQQHHHPRQSLLSKFLKRFQLRSIRSQSKLNQSTSTSSLTSLSSTSASIAKILSLGKQLHRDVSLDPSLPSVSYGQCQCCNYKYRKPFNDSNFSTILKHSDHQRAKNDLIRSKSRTSNSLASNFSLLGQTHLTNHNQSSSAKSTRLEDFNYFTIFDDEIYFDSEVTYDIWSWKFHFKNFRID